MRSAVRILVISLCHAPSIDDADGKKRADCLTPPKGGGVSARSGRVGDAQLERLLESKSETARQGAA
jgi:hypothetical protein